MNDSTYRQSSFFPLYSSSVRGNFRYREGLMGDLEQGAESREQVLAQWQRRLERLWLEVEPSTGA